MEWLNFRNITINRHCWAVQNGSELMHVSSCAKWTNNSGYFFSLCWSPFFLSITRIRTSVMQSKIKMNRHSSLSLHLLSTIDPSTFSTVDVCSIDHSLHRRFHSRPFSLSTFSTVDISLCRYFISRQKNLSIFGYFPVKFTYFQLTRLSKSSRQWI